MRVLHISPGNLYGGVEMLLSTLARYHDLCPEMKPEFAFCFDGRIATELLTEGATVHMLGGVRVRNPIQVRDARRKLSDLLRKENFDVVICHMAWPLAIFGPAVRRSGTRLFFWMHDAVTNKSWLNAWAARTRPDFVLCNSTYSASTLARLFKQVAGEVIYCPVADEAVHFDADRRGAFRETLHTSHDAVVILQASRMEAWKGQRGHLRALGQLRESPDWVCWMAGGAQRPQEMAYEHEVRSLAVELGISDRVRFLGQRTDVSHLMGAADIYCQPNEGPEPFGIVFIEAMYSRLPVVTANCGGPVEIVNDDYGVLVSVGDAEMLANNLRRLIEDRELRHRIGELARQRAKALCDVGAQMQRLSQLLAKTRLPSRTSADGLSSSII